MSSQLLDTTETPLPLPDLEPIGLALRDIDVRRQLLTELAPTEALIATGILQRATQLEYGTALDGDTLARCLGCPVATISDFRDLGTEELWISSRYMEFLLVLQAVVETPADKRLLLLGYGHLYPAAEKDVERLQAAFLNPDADRAFNLLELGEVQAALDKALLYLRPDAFRRPRNPFADLPEVHISSSRLDALIVGDHDVLGSEMVVPRMLDHINGREGHTEGCVACRDAYSVRSEQLARQGELRHTPVSY